MIAVAAVVVFGVTVCLYDFKRHWTFVPPPQSLYLEGANKVSGTVVAELAKFVNHEKAERARIEEQVLDLLDELDTLRHDTVTEVGAGGWASLRC